MVTGGVPESNDNKDSEKAVPAWINVMSRTKFFINCVVHGSSKKNELDRFCIYCVSSLCHNCLPNHLSHEHIKIRRYVYSDVIKRQDLRKLFDCSGIQTYRTNKAKVLFLKQRPPTLKQEQQQNNSKDYSCIVCGRSLQDNTRYCSIECKVLAINGENQKGREEKRNEESTLKKKPRRSSRKGVPCRAPMF